MPKHNKLTKESVDYSRGMNSTRCKNCVHFKPLSHTCEIVQGKIDPEYWCKRFRKD